MPMSSTLYLQYAALSLLIVGGLVTAASWGFIVKSADAAARAWFSAVAMQLMSGMVLFAVGTEWRETAYFLASIIMFSSLYVTLYSTTLMLKVDAAAYLVAIWAVHLVVFVFLNRILQRPDASFMLALSATTIQEIAIVVSLRRIRTQMQLTATLFAEVAFGAAILGCLIRLATSLMDGRILLYTDLSIQSVIAMSLQCVLIVMSCFYYIGIAIQRAETRELEMRLEADQLRLRQKMAEEHARETQKLIDERDRMMILNSRFSAMSTLSLLGAGVVHEISQPLQAARSAMDVLALHKALSPSELAKHSAGVLRLIDRASTVVENLRRLIREKRVDQEDVDCEKLLRRIFPIFISEAKRRAVEVNFTTDGETEGKLVSANPVMLERIMFNLAANALEAFDEDVTPSAGAAPARKLHVDIRAMESQNRSALVIGFHDTGKGVADSAYDQMFEPLTSYKADGTGLGLYLVKTFVESWNGSVRAGRNRSETRGTSIEITLPVASTGLAAPLVSRH